jgi:hypothetical protein
MAVIARLKQPWEDLSRYRPLFTMFYSHHPHQKISTTLLLTLEVIAADALRQAPSGSGPRHGLTITGARYDLWWAVEQDAQFLDILVQSRRNKKAAQQFFNTLLQGRRAVPRVLITDPLQSYAAAKREVMRSVASPRMARSPNTVAPVATSWRHWPTVKTCGNASRHGGRSPARQWRRKGRVGCCLTPSVPDERLTVS